MRWFVGFIRSKLGFCRSSCILVQINQYVFYVSDPSLMITFWIPFQTKMDEMFKNILRCFRRILFGRIFILLIMQRKGVPLFSSPAM